LKLGLYKVKKVAMENKSSAAELVSVIKKIVIESESEAKNKYANKIKKEVNKYANKIKKEVNNYSNNPDIEINNILYAFNKKQKLKIGVAEKNKKQT
jgi:TATA-box binding protein (TBP) (component of TFIID and TFIIIB)